MAAASHLANIGASQKTNRCRAWKLFGATAVGVSSMHIITNSTLPKIETRAFLFLLRTASPFLMAFNVWSKQALAHSMGKNVEEPKKQLISRLAKYDGALQTI